MSHEYYSVIAVDDEPHVLDGLKMINWQQHGFEMVATFEQAEDALDFLKQEPIDLVLTDVRMPGVNGFDFVKAIRMKVDRPEIIMISGYKEFDYVRRAMTLEVQDYLVKPIFEEDVYEALAKMAVIIENKKKLKTVNQISMNDLLREYIRSKVEPGKEVRERLKDFEDTRLSHNLWVIFINYDYTTEFNEVDLGIKEFIDVDAFQTWVDSSHPYIIYEYGLNHLEALRVAYTRLRTRLIHHTSQTKVQPLSNNQWHLHHEYDKETMKHKLNQINESFEQGLSKEIDLKLSLFFVYCEDACIPLEEVKKWLYDFYLKLVLKIERYEKTCQKGSICEDDDQENKIYLEGIDNMEALYHFIGEKLHELLSKYQTMDEEKPAIITQIENYIEKHFQERLTIKDLADQFYMHPNYLGQLMKQHWQMGFTEYLHRYRIHKAMKLLKEDKTSIEEIAYVVGYINYQQFLKYYKLYTNQVPTVTRKDNEII